MIQDVRNLRATMRFLLSPPVAGSFAGESVAVADLSERGARLRHKRPLETGTKGRLLIAIDQNTRPVALEALVVWSGPDSSAPGQFLSGIRTYGEDDAVRSLLTRLEGLQRTQRIEELRANDRFYVSPLLDASFGGEPVRIENLSVRGCRIETAVRCEPGESRPFQLELPNSSLRIVTEARVIWTNVKAITGGDGRSFCSGLLLSSQHDMTRLLIGHLCEAGRAMLDTRSLRLKLKIFRARARQHAASVGEVAATGIPAEQYLLVQGVREELRLNPDEAVHWYRRARLLIADPATRAVASPIASHPDALAVWEYLDRSIDPTIVGRVFSLN